jgi:hypothetical protein
MALIEHNQRTLCLPYPSTNYSVPDTMMSIPIQLCFKRYRSSSNPHKTLFFGLDMIGRRSKPLDVEFYRNQHTNDEMPASCSSDLHKGDLSE